MTSLDANNRKDDDSYTSPLLRGEITSLATLNGKAFVAEFFPWLIGNTSLCFPAAEKELLFGKWYSVVYFPENSALCWTLGKKQMQMFSNARKCGYFWWLVGYIWKWPIGLSPIMVELCLCTLQAASLWPRFPHFWNENGTNNSKVFNFVTKACNLER